MPPNQLNVHLSTVSVNWIHDTRDNVLDAHRGVYETCRLGVNPAWLGSNFSFATFFGQAAYYKDIGKGIIWANSLRLGLEQAYGGIEVPLSQRFFSGGSNSLRGFPLNGAGPQRSVLVCSNPSEPATCSKITVPAGGNELLILNSELRFPLNAIKRGLGIVTFYDGGNVFPTIGFTISRRSTVTLWASDSATLHRLAQFASTSATTRIPSPASNLHKCS